MVKRKIQVTPPVRVKRRGRGRRASDSNFVLRFTNAGLSGCLFLIALLTLVIKLSASCVQGDNQVCQLGKFLARLLME